MTQPAARTIEEEIYQILLEYQTWLSGSYEVTGSPHRTLPEAIRSIEALIQQRELEARIDEIGMVKAEYGNMRGVILIKGGFVDVRDRYQHLRKQLATLKGGTDETK